MLNTSNYRDWQIVLHQEHNGISADFHRDGEEHVSPFCFQTAEAAGNYAKGCIDQLQRLEEHRASPVLEIA